MGRHLRLRGSAKRHQDGETAGMGTAPDASGNAGGTGRQAGDQPTSPRNLTAAGSGRGRPDPRSRHFRSAPMTAYLTTYESEMKGGRGCENGQCCTSDWKWGIEKTECILHRFCPVCLFCGVFGPIQAGWKVRISKAITLVEMPGWLPGTPWWVILGFTITILIILFKVGRWTGSINVRLDSLDSRLDSFENVVEEIREDIKQIFSRLPRKPVEGSSPVRLTDYGERISATVDALEWARPQAPDPVVDAKGK